MTAELREVSTQRERQAMNQKMLQKISAELDKGANLEGGRGRCALAENWGPGDGLPGRELQYDWGVAPIRKIPNGPFQIPVSLSLSRFGLTCRPLWL